MKASTSFTILLNLLLVIFGLSVQGQTGVLNPDDPITVYNPAAPPATPAYGTLAKWVKTDRVGFVTSSFKSYYYKGMAFRLKFPKSYKDSLGTGKKYPIFVFFHGKGEGGSVYDNEYQLYHGGEVFRNAVDNGQYDGFLLYPQSSSGSGTFNGTHAQIINELILNYFVPQINVDVNRVSVDGLSGGGAASWGMVRDYPNLVAASLPISAASVADGDAGTVSKLKFTPIWMFSGDLDNAPSPFTATGVYNSFKNAGSNIKYTLYPNQGHGCWYSAWAEPDFFPFITRAHKANPWSLNGRNEYCPGDAISQVIGVTAGFDGYEWSKDGILIPGASSNTITATSVGVYACRIKRGTTWSVWSPIPVTIKLKGATVSPDITVVGQASKVIPSPDGNTTVQLQVPAGYATYNWQKDGNSTILSTTRLLTVAAAGNYKVKVTEAFGCSSNFSNLFAVIDANAANGPSSASGVVATPVSKTSIKLDWSQNPVPAFNETGFEIYRSATATGPYALIYVTAADVVTYTNTALNSNSKYYYKIRAINANAASSTTDAVSATTLADVTAPTAPGNLRTASSTNNSVQLIWDESTDDVSVTEYDIYVNGVKYYETEQSQFTVYNLQHGQTYTFRVKARDFAGNTSPFSNQTSAQALLNGLSFKYYTFTGTWNNLPDFNTLEADAVGQVPNITLANRTQSDNFAFLWEGFITITQAGEYTFRTNSDDGSKLYLSPYTFGATALVNNDGLHGGQDRDGTITLQPGVYPFAASFYEQGGGEAMTVSWKKPGSANFEVIPNSAFADEKVVDGQPPVKPEALAATAISYKEIDLTWADSSNNEAGFEIYRSTSSFSGFATVGNTAANVTSYKDTTLDANTTYYYRIKAINQYGESAFDKAGGGVTYAYYENNNVSSLPDFNALTPKKTGVVTNFDISVRDQNDNFQFKFSSYVNIPTAGTYTFYTTSDDGSKLYIDAFDEAHRVVNNDGAHAMQEASGTVTLTAGYHQIYATFFELGGGEGLEVRYSGNGIDKQLIPSSALGEPLVNATTSPLPPAPAAPDSLVALGVSTAAINVKWKDVATEVKYELYRSSNVNTNYILYKTLPANATSFADTALYSNSFFYYKIRAVNDGGNSAFSNEDSTKTLNNIPVLNAIGDQFMRFGTQLQLNVAATDADAETLTVTVSNLPSFAGFVPSVNGGIITFNSTVTADQGTYNDISVIVKDQHNGSDTVIFKLIVGANHQPVIAPVSNVTLNEKQTTQINLSATDQNAGDVLTWSFSGLPSFATVVKTAGTAQITLAPGYADNGVYPVIAKIEDGNDGVDTESFTITVNDINPNKTISVNFSDGTYVAGAPWNNTAKAPVINDDFANLKDGTGATTPIGIKLLTAWTGINNAGVNTGNNSGIYPDAVIRSSYYTAGARTIRIYGLNTADKYSFTFLGSRANPTVGVVSTYAIGGQTVSLNASNNSLNTVSINNLQPAADGTLVLTVNNASGSTYGYLNAMVIKSTYDDGTVPAKPRSLAAQMYSGKVRLNWIDAAYNETGYEVYRSNTRAGAYTLLNPGGNNAGLQLYDDLSVSGNKTYYYAVKAVNAVGSSPYSDTVSITTPNIAPVLAAIANVNMNTGQTVNVDVSATDEPGDVTILSATGLPAFATFTDNGNGTGKVTITPGNSYGAFNNVTITATDNANAASSKQFNIVVTNTNINTNILLTAVGISKTQVKLNWSAVTNATGYEVWTSATATGTYTKLTDIAAGTITYTQSGLTAATVYYYKVRAVVSATPTSYSNYAGASTVAYTVNLNMNDGSVNAPAQAGNWNNLNALINNGFTLPNMKNDLGQNTGINFNVVRNFSGFNYLGATTGNNSGVYPDNVIKSFYYTNYADTAKIKITGLTLAHEYNFVFFGSRINPSVGVVSAYKIGNQIVTLNAANNSANVIKITGIKPDANGAVDITIYATQTGGFAYLNALGIEGAPDVAEDPALGGSLKVMGAEDATPVTLMDNSDKINGLSIYPNPFVNDVTLSMNLSENVSKFTIMVTDISGRTIFKREVANAARGVWSQKIGLNGQTLKGGLYFIQVYGIPGKKANNLKILKQ